MILAAASLLRVALTFLGVWGFFLLIVLVCCRMHNNYNRAIFRPPEYAFFVQMAVGIFLFLVGVVWVIIYV